MHGAMLPSGEARSIAQVVKKPIKAGKKRMGPAMVVKMSGLQQAK
jgi:hypothetical protein